MKKNNVTKFAILLLALTMIATMLVSGTYAKYTSTFESGTDTAIVAKWDVSAGYTSETFNIFDVSEIYDTNVADIDYTQAGTDDLDVANGTTNGIIAPGTWGKFSYTITNHSDVNATYAVTYTVNEAGTYLQWSTDGSTWTDSLANIPTTAIDMKTGEANTDVTKTIYWRWVFEAENEPIAVGQSDNNDTILGTAGTATPTISISTVFTQVD